MSAPEAGAPLTSEAQLRRTSPVTRMVAWGGASGRRLETARVVLGERSMRASGTLISATPDDPSPYSASYSLHTNESGVVQRLVVRVVRAEGEQHVTLNRSEEGIWLVDDGAGAVRTDFDGALDIDLAFSPLFNALPVRRLALHQQARAQDLPVVFVALPGLGVQLQRQTYRTVSPGEPAVVRYASGSFEADLTVDVDGLVLDYPGLAGRVGDLA